MICIIKHSLEGGGLTLELEKTEGSNRGAMEEKKVGDGECGVSMEFGF